MKKFLHIAVTIFIITTFVYACKKENGTTEQLVAQNSVSGKVTDAAGNPMAGIKVIIEHTLWSATYIYATTNSNGYYQAELPKDPAGSWTVKAQIEKSAYGQQYKFDLHPSSIDPFTRNDATVRNFTWKLSGAKPSGKQFYGAHVDLYQWATDVPMTQVKLVFTPLAGETLIDGSSAKTVERTVEDYAGTFMVRDIPVGRYKVQAIFQGKTLLLDNRKDNGEPELQKPVVFGKNGYLGDTDYNIEFWLSE